MPPKRKIQVRFLSAGLGDKNAVFQIEENGIFLI